MLGQVFSGQLIYIDTEAGKIRVLDRDDNRWTELNIDADTQLPFNLGRDWESMLGDDVDVIVIDGKTKYVSLTKVEEE